MVDTLKTGAVGELDGWTFVTAPDTFTSASLDDTQGFDTGMQAVLYVTVAHIDANAMTAGSATVKCQVDLGDAANDGFSTIHEVNVTATTATLQLLRAASSTDGPFLTADLPSNLQVYGAVGFVYDEDTPANCELITVDSWDSGATGNVTPIGGLAHDHGDTTDDAVLDIVDEFAFAIPDGNVAARIVMGVNDADADLAIRVDYALIEKFVSA